jgi:hypothetical protein
MCSVPVACHPVEGFFLELLYGIAERLILGTLFEATMGLGDI